jgi:hypothetical protein
MDVVAHEIPFLAPVPRGHDVLVVWFKRTPEAPNESAALVLDQTGGILYCDDTLWGPLGTDPRASTDPVGVLTRWSWTVTRSYNGTVQGCAVSTKDRGDSNHAKTRLFVERTNSTPYR